MHFMAVGMVIRDHIHFGKGFVVGFGLRLRKYSHSDAPHSRWVGFGLTA